MMAEPGRYFAASAFTLAAYVHSKREVRDPNTGAHNNMYYINDGVYGSFNSILYDHATVQPLPLSVRKDYFVFDADFLPRSCERIIVHRGYGEALSYYA